ncbi:MAG: nucleoside kinase, partial [Firmicutes bacterium]|nr:nucleoside kinase [Bacillota bacterium]
MTVNLLGTGPIALPPGARALDALRYDRLPRRSPIVAARVNNALKSLQTTLTPGCSVEFVDLEDEDGMRVYTRSLVLILARSAHELYPGCTVSVEHSLGNGLYGEIHWERPLKASDFAKIEARMREIVAADEPILRRRVKREEAVEILRQHGQPDNASLLEYVTSPTVHLHASGGFWDYAYGALVPRTGLLTTFRLRFYLPGFILELPERHDPTVIPEYVEQGKLANVYYEAERWGRILNVQNVAALNHVIETGHGPELIRVAEAFHEKKIAQIADQIVANLDRIRIVLIAGPSSSGKTTFAQRLAIQLRVNGILPVPISMDNYFVEREKTPRDAEGNYDFDSPAALDQELFNDNLAKLIQGEEVELPTFNFMTGKREYNGRVVRLTPRHLVVVEGIHGLNDRLTSTIPQGRKFKIYVSALTQLNLDRLNRIPTTDVRLLRRIVRDHQFRGHSALSTLQMWESVRRGEQRNIFPFQEAADVMFNSALVYELAVLKKYADPLLAEIPPTAREHAEARRLRKFLSYFASLDDKDIPATSI